MTKALYIMIGGFLGAGKTTAMARLARHLTEDGKTVGLITNDQGSGLVDTLTLRSQGFEVEEIAGGCFCCRFNSLVAAAETLTEATRPDVFLAEPVGSCTDLVASVSYPLRRIYGENYTTAPLSVLVDPVRASRVLGLESGRRFSSKVQYIYEKQLEEADVLVINKCDSFDPAARQSLRQALTQRWPHPRIFEVSAREGDGLDAWFEYVTTTEIAGRPAMSIDYTLYGEGEALLGWVNCTAQIVSSHPVDGNELLQTLMRGLQDQLQDTTTDIAHLKMTLSTDGGLGETGVVSLVRQDFVPELSQRLSGALTNAELIVNLRAEADPLLLQGAVEKQLGELDSSGGISVKVEHIEGFQPGQPVPTHRVENPES